MKWNHKKLTVILTGSLILSAAFCMPALAMEGWQEDGESWSYVDSRGDRVAGEWKRIDGRWYYFDSDGRMVSSSWIDSDSYVGANGARVESAWILGAPSEEPQDSWYYLKENGKKAVEEDGWQKIDGGYYLFDSEGRMKTGWQQWGDDVFYLGQDGRRVTGWNFLQLNLTEEEQFLHSGNSSEGEGWFWFASNGKCCRSEGGKKINGRKYCFDENGRMMSGWVLDGTWESIGAATASDAYIGLYSYYGGEEDGARASGWIREETPGDIGGDGEVYDYYIKNGRPFSVFEPGQDRQLKEKGLLRIEARTDETTGEGYACRLSVNGKRYLFNHRGELLYGLQPVFGGDGNLIGSCMSDTKSGELESGRVKIEDGSGDKVEFYFDADRVGLTGRRDGRAYYLGRLQAAEDGYRLISLPKDITSAGETGYVTFLVDEKGKIQDKAGKRYATENAGEVILFANPDGEGMSLYHYIDSSEKADYLQEEALIENMMDCADYMEALSEPDWQ